MNIFKSIGKAIKKHGDDILIYSGIAGCVISVGSTVFATINSVDDVKEAKKKSGKDKLTNKEMLKTTWKNFIIPASTLVASGFCIIEGHHLSKKAAAISVASASASLSTLGNDIFNAYRTNTKKIVGEEKEKEIAEETKKDVPDSMMFFGPYCLCYDEPTKRFFRSSYSELMDIKASLATRLLDEMIITMHDISDEEGLDRADGGERMGFDINRNRFDMRIERAGVAENGEPYLIVDYTPIPLR